jgi:hypothetical protein
MKEANRGTAPHRSANAWQFISITVFSRMGPVVLACTPVELAFTHGPRGTSLKENGLAIITKSATDGNVAGGSRRGAVRKNALVSVVSLFSGHVCPYKNISAFDDVLAFFKLEIPSGGLSNLRLRDVEKQPLAKIKHA